MCCWRLALDELGDLPDDVYLSVNVSPRTVMSRTCPSCCGTSTRRLVLELTEHMPVEDYVSLNVALKDLPQEGHPRRGRRCRAGFSSLNHILLIRPEIVKLESP